MKVEFETSELGDILSVETSQFLRVEYTKCIETKNGR